MPIGLEYLQLVVTGPPGAGKSYYINQIRGWPNEGYIDLTRKGWWSDQTLIYRPREVHLGMPFVGIAEALTVFDKEWLEISPTPELEFNRIQLPPEEQSIFQTNWRDRYIFEFLIPDPEVTLQRRLERQNQGYFPVDSVLSEEIVQRQAQAYQEIALYLHRAGVNVYIRKDLASPPMRIAEKGVAAVPQWAITSNLPKPDLRTIAGWKQFLWPRKSNWFTITDEMQPLTGTSRVAHDGKTFEMVLGKERLRFHPEIPLGIKKKNLHKNWVVNTPQACSSSALCGFIRIIEGETVILGKSNKEYCDILQLSKEISKRHVAITNSRGDLTISPLDGENGVKLVRFDDLDYRERVEVSRYKSFVSLRKLFGEEISILQQDTAQSLIENINSLLDREPMRPLNSQGKAGGLIDLKQRATPIIVGDLHANVDNLLKILTENSLLKCLGNKSATLIILGDAVHSEHLDQLEEMESSALMMDLIFLLKMRFPENFFYIRGNHDSFDPEISKGGISQGLLMKEYLTELRGERYVEQMEIFYSKLPYLVKSQHFFGCHAAPPRVKFNREDLVNIHENPELIREVTCNRLQRPNYLSGYNKSDIKRLRKVLNLPKGTPFIVGHTPLDPFSSFWKNVGTIKNHHIIYSAHQQGPAIMQRIQDKMIPLTFPAEPLTKLINDLR